MLAGRYDNPMPESTVSPSQETMNLANALFPVSLLKTVFKGTVSQFFLQVHLPRTRRSDRNVQSDQRILNDL
jgi:hypothetical protein